MIQLVCPACRTNVDGTLQASILTADQRCDSCGAQHHYVVTEARRSDDVWARNHWDQQGQFDWATALLERLDDVPDGPALILGAAACGAIQSIPQERSVVCLDHNRAGLEHACWMAATGHDRLASATLLHANALDPPLKPKSFALVLCLNLVDSIADPEILLSQCEALLAPRGAMLLSTPYQFREDVTPKERWLDSLLACPDDLEGAVEKLVTGAWDPAFMSSMRLQWSDRSVPWRVVVNERMAIEYTMHALLLRRLPTL